MNAMRQLNGPESGESTDLVAGVLTAKQSAFVREFVALGGQQGKAAGLAGYADPDASAHRLVRLPHVQAAIRAETSRLVLEGGTKGVRWMTNALDDAKLSGAVRFQCAKWLAEGAGHGLAAARAQLGLPDPDKPLNEMTLDELDAFMQAGRKALDTLKQDKLRTIDGEVVRDVVHDVQPHGVQVADPEG